MDDIFSGIFYSLTKEGSPISSWTGSTTKGIGKGLIGTVKKFPGTSLGVATAAMSSVPAAQEFGKAFGSIAKVPGKRVNLNESMFPQGVPGKMFGGF